MTKIDEYSSGFYNVQSIGALKSARAVVPLLMDLIAPRSVIDVGCGIGAWLQAFQENGVCRIFGIDGSWAKTAGLLISEKFFQEVDLDKALAFGKNTFVDENFDLCISLEVAEHLNENNSEAFVSLLCNISNLVLFSAAIPFQGGRNHFNEQWCNYWEDLFKRAGYIGTGNLRWLVWNNKDIRSWYRQNLLLFAKTGTPSEKFIEIVNRRSMTIKGIPSVVNPDFYLEVHKFYRGDMYLESLQLSCLIQLMQRHLIKPIRSLKSIIKRYLRLIIPRDK